MIKQKLFHKTFPNAYGFLTDYPAVPAVAFLSSDCEALAKWNGIEGSSKSGVAEV